MAYFKAGQFADAIPPLRAVISKLPGNAQAELLLGMSLYGAGDYKEAAEYLEPASHQNAG